MDKKIIKQVRIDQSNMTSLSSSRTLSIAGEVGAEFIVNVIKINSTSKESYYNFKTKSFTTAFTSKNSFRLKMAGSSFQLAILFPADATGDVYSILVMAKPETTQFSNGQFVVTKKITQVGQTTVFLEVDEGSEINSTFTNKASDTHGFGFMLPNRPASNRFIIPDNFWFTQQAQIVNGTTSSSTTLVLDSVVNLVVGMTLSTVSSGSISGAPIITAINGNTITLSVAQSLGDGVTLGFRAINNDVSCGFRAYGPSLIKQVFGLDIVFNNFVAKGTQLTKVVRTNTTFPASDGNVTLNLNGTYGISGNNTM